MRQSFITFFIVFAGFLSANGFAWNATGHRLIAQIAVDHLTPHAKLRFNAYNRLLNNKKYKYNLVGAATWLDTVRDKKLSLPGSMHYIDIPFSAEKTSLPPVNSMNAVVALREARTMLINPYSKPSNRAIALRMILHITGDLHQPLHAATHVSRDHPMGDKGGNLTRLPKNPVATNLHAYWDKGAGLLTRMNNRDIKQYAAKIEARWPCSKERTQQDPMLWAEESHAIAIHYAYAFQNTTPLDAIYQRSAPALVEERIALAGCRLSAVLNEVDEAIRIG